MKKLKQLGALMLALVLAVALCCPAFATEATYSITIKNEAAGHTYEAYQIFAGDLYEGKLSNIEWGNGVDADKVTAKFSGKSAADVAEELAKKTDNSEEAKAYAKNFSECLSTTCTSSSVDGQTYKISDLSAGYYLVKDKDASLDSQADDFYTGYIMKVVGDVTVTPKGEKPTLDKQIKHNEENNGEGTWGVVGDNQIGDTVEFRTITTVPDIAGYTDYKYIIHDTMSDGLTSNVKSISDVTVKVNDETVLDTKYYTVAVDSTNSNMFTVTFAIDQAISNGVLTKGNKLYTYYSGVLNESALIYDNGKQDNTAYLEYSNNPNDTNEKGKTPEKKVYDWTFKMGINKVDGASESLTGAKFVLSENSGLNVTDMQCNDSGVPDVTTNLIALIDNNDGTYTVAPTDYTGDTTFVITAGNVVIKGLDDSTDYYLYETKAPDGYNLLKNVVKFKIAATYSADGSKLETDSPTVTVNGGAASTELSTNVVNNAGSTLPSTGGMGTTVLYVVGGALVVCAGVALVAKKRMQ